MQWREERAKVIRFLLSNNARARKPVPFIKLTAGNYCPLRHRKSLTRCGEFNIRTTEKITVTRTPERQISVGKDLSTVICGGTRAEVSADGKGMIAYTNDGVETNSTRLLLR
jgi:hypothetical protein